MLTPYIPPTKWYRSEVAWHIKIVFWPSWLARRLCDHSAASQYQKDNPQMALLCPDCGKLLIPVDGEGL